jgi:hypothetical protein
VENGRGNGALRKLGAVQEGVLRKSFLHRGRYLDQALGAILRDDRFAAKAVWERRSTSVFSEITSSSTSSRPAGLFYQDSASNQIVPWPVRSAQPVSAYNTWLSSNVCESDLRRAGREHTGDQPHLSSRGPKC